MQSLALNTHGMVALELGSTQQKPLAAPFGIPVKPNPYIEAAFWFALSAIALAVGSLMVFP